MTLRVHVHELEHAIFASAHFNLIASRSHIILYFQFIEIASVIEVNLEQHAVTGAHINVRARDVQHIVQSHL